MPEQVVGGPAILLECRTALAYLGYDQVPTRERDEWLGDRFFRPSDVPGTYDLARINNVRRIRAACWSAISPVEVERLQEQHKDKQLKRGRPPLWRTKGTALRKIVHEPQRPMPERWRWPLATLAMEEELPIEERLWLLVRRGVLSPMMVRWCAVGALEAAVEVLGGVGIADFSVRVKALARQGAPLAKFREGLLALAREQVEIPQDSRLGIFAAAREVLGSDVDLALARTIGYVGIACDACGYSPWVTRERCYDGIKHIILFEGIPN